MTEPKKWPEYKELRTGFTGKQFRALVQYHVRLQSLPKLAEAIQETIGMLSPETLAVSEAVIDEFNDHAYQKQFWEQDCGDVFEAVCGKVSQGLIDQGSTLLTDDILNTFQLIVLNFAKTAHEQPAFRRFAGIKRGLFW